MQNLLAKLSGFMSKTHIGFAAVLIGGVLVFMPMTSAMATPSSTLCRWVENNGNCLQSTNAITKPAVSFCYSISDSTSSCFTNGSNYYTFSECAGCADGYKLVTKTMSSTQCGTITYQDCELDDSIDGGGVVQKYCPTNNIVSEGINACDPDANPINLRAHLNCKSLKVQCFGTYTVATCESCEGSLQLQDDSYSPSGCTNSYSYKACDYCTTADDCKPVSGSGIGGIISTIVVGGVAKQQFSTTVYACSDWGICSSTKDCWCGAGYYGDAGCDVTCQRCPLDEKSGQNGTSPSAQGQSTTIDDCYIPVDTAFSTSVGSGTYSEQCPY